MKRILGYFTKSEIALWSASVFVIAFFFGIFDRENYLTLAASLLGVTSIILNAKGNPAGQFLMVIFSVLYGMISFKFAYYGEMFTYLGMTGPMALFALVSWLRNPYKGKRSEVAVNHIGLTEMFLMLLVSAAVTLGFYFILDYFETANLVLSTFSVTTSFIAVYLTFRRSEWFSLAYAANDVVLIVLWILASLEETSYVSVVACFVAFFANDMYGFFAWRKMKKRQKQGK